MEVKDIADRISAKFAAAGHPLDRAKLEERITRFVEEFSVPPGEAERSITHDYARQFGMEIPDRAPSKENRGDINNISDIQAEQWVNVEGIIVVLFPPRSPSVAQSGILADNTGTIRFTVWAKANATIMEAGKWYRVESAVADEYNGQVSLKVHSGTTISPLNQEEISHLEISDINNIKPGVVSVKGKVVRVEKPPSDNFIQRGIITDETGAIRFSVRNVPGAEILSENRWYTIKYAIADTYKGVLSIQIPPAAAVPEEDDRSIRPAIIPVAQIGPGIVSLRVKMIQEYDTTSDRILQSGLIGDESGTIRFISWKNEGGSRLEPDTVYTIYYASVDQFNDRLSVTLSGAVCVPDETANIEVRSPDEVVTGAFVHMSPGSGLIKRCPVDGCGRVLSRQNYCQIHEIQPNFSYDLRIKGWIDTGVATFDTVIAHEGVEKLTGLSLQSAQDMAENDPLGLDTIFYHINEKILGRYLICRGRKIDNRFFAKFCEFQVFDQGKLAELINRAEESSNE